MPASWGAVRADAALAPAAGLADAPLPSAAPALSIVVPSVNGLGDLRGCLQALERQRADVEIEIIVADRLGDVVRETVGREFPRVRVLAAPVGTTIPALRMLAFDAACGESVAVIEDHVLVPSGWAKRMLAAQGDSTPVVGGGVENGATARLVDWAAFLCEYSHCIPPLPEGPSDWVTGNNVVYPRALLRRYRDELAADKWEDHLHGLLRRDGIVLTSRPEISVVHKKHYTVREYFTQRYLYARSYAGARVSGWPVHRRAAYGAAAAALPPVLYARVVGRVLGKRRHRAELVRSLPLLALFVCAWGAGEVMGAWFGPGDALEHVC